MEKLKIWNDFFNYLLEEVFEPVEETEETMRWEQELLAEQEQQMQAMLDDDYIHPKQTKEEIDLFSDKLTLDIDNVDEETAKQIYLQGLKDSVMIFKVIGVIK